MKKLRISLIVISLLVGVSCEKTPDIDKEVAAIMSVIQREGNAHATHDLDGLQNVYIHDSLTVRAHTRKNNYSILKGWDSVNSLFESWMTMDMSNYKNLVNSKENVIIKVIDDCAWLICDNDWDFEYEGNPITDSEIQITFLEKIDNEWKISFNSIVTKPGPKRE